MKFKILISVMPFTKVIGPAIHERRTGKAVPD